jgi:integrase
MAAAKMERTKTPGVYKRGGRYAITYRDHDGRQRWESARTYDDARKLKAKRTQEVESGEWQQQSRVRFAAYAREWVDRYQGRGSGFREDTRDDYRRDLERYAIPYLDARLKRTLSQVTPRDVANFVGWLCDDSAQRQRHANESAARERENEERRQRNAQLPPGAAPEPMLSALGPPAVPLADATVRRLIAPLRACLATAVREGLIRSNPCADVALPARDAQRRIDDDHDDDQDVKLPTREQLATLLQVAVHPEHRLLLQLLAGTGLRISEAIALRWRDVELDGSRPNVKVRRRLVRGRLGPPKSKRSRRDVPISHPLVIALRQRRERTEWARPDDIVLCSSVGTPLSPSNLRRDLLPLVEEAGVPWLGFHALRHFFASALIAEGRNIVQVSRLLGHHSPAFTLSVYAHLMDESAGGPLDLDAALALPAASVAAAVADVAEERV